MTDEADEVNVRLPGGGDGVRRRHALVVGIDDYATPALHLPFCVADATRLRDLLAGRGYQVTTLVSGGGARARPTRPAGGSCANSGSPTAARPATPRPSP